MGIGQNEKFLTKRSPSFGTRSDYQNILTPTEPPQTVTPRPHNVLFKRSDPENIFVPNKQKAYTPPEQSNSYPFETRRPNTPDGRFREQESHPIRIKEYSQNISPLVMKNSHDMFQLENYARDDTKDRFIDLLKTRVNQDQEEIKALRQLNDELRQRIDGVSVENIQAKNLLSHETKENMELTNQLNSLKREMEGLREKHQMASRRAGFEMAYGQVRYQDNQYYPTAIRDQFEQSHYHSPPRHISATRVNNEMEEMKQKLIMKDQELEEMRTTCANERKEKQTYYKSYEDVLQLLEKDIA